MKSLFVLIVYCLSVTVVYSNSDSLSLIKDSINQKQISDSLFSQRKQQQIIQDSLQLAMYNQQQLQLFKDFPLVANEKATYMIVRFNKPVNKDVLFYVFLGCVIFFSVVKIIFPKYVKSIFAIPFQTSFRQNQTKEQLLQDNLASLLFNIFFVIVASFYVALLIEKNNWVSKNYFILSAYCAIAITTIYFFKLIFTKFLGYLFSVNQDATNYNFTVFVFNKILGILLLPLLFFIAFSSTSVSWFCIQLSIIIIIILFTIRLFIKYKNISSSLKVNPIHFFLYFCSIEILPLLILFKFFNKQIGSGIKL